MKCYQKFLLIFLGGFLECLSQNLTITGYLQIPQGSYMGAPDSIGNNMMLSDSVPNGNTEGSTASEPTGNNMGSSASGSNGNNQEIMFSGTAGSNIGSSALGPNGNNMESTIPGSNTNNGGSTASGTTGNNVGSAIPGSSGNNEGATASGTTNIGSSASESNGNNTEFTVSGSNTNNGGSTASGTTGSNMGSTASGSNGNNEGATASETTGSNISSNVSESNGNNMGSSASESNTNNEGSTSSGTTGSTMGSTTSESNGNKEGSTISGTSGSNMGSSASGPNGNNLGSATSANHRPSLINFQDMIRRQFSEINRLPFPLDKFAYTYLNDYLKFQKNIDYLIKSGDQPISGLIGSIAEAVKVTAIGSRDLLNILNLGTDTIIQLIAATTGTILDALLKGINRSPNAILSILARFPDILGGGISEAIRDRTQTCLEVSGDVIVTKALVHGGGCLEEQIDKIVDNLQAILLDVIQISDLFMTFLLDLQNLPLSQFPKATYNFIAGEAQSTIINLPLHLGAPFVTLAAALPGIVICAGRLTFMLSAQSIADVWSFLSCEVSPLLEIL